MSSSESNIPGEAGRPMISIDWDVVNKMLEAGAKGTEVAAKLGIHADTLYNRCAELYGMTFSDYSAKNKAKGDYDLRLEQHSKAKAGNTMMLIWLGKQRLEQRENPGDVGLNQQAIRESILLEQEIERRANQKLASALQQRGIGFSNLENEQALLNQDGRGKEDPIPVQLGSEGSLQ